MASRTVSEALVEVSAISVLNFVRSVRKGQMFVRVTKVKAHQLTQQADVVHEEMLSFLLCAWLLAIEF
jgi:hypothetical protein